MAAEILHDLELDHPPYQGVGISAPLSPGQMEGIRAYLSCYYLVTAHVLPFLQYLRKTTLTDSRFAMAWARMSQVALSYTSWTATCCDLLERGSALKGDHTLAWLARLLHITEEASETTKNIPRTEQAKQQAHFMLLGLESQLRDWQSQIPSSLGDVNSIKIAILFTEIFLLAGPVYRLTSVSKVGDPSLGPPIPAPRLERCLTLLRSLFDFIVNLDKAALVEMSSIDWGRFIQATIVAIRLSFPLPLCPEWDHARAREQLQFDSYLAKLSTHHEELTPSTKSMDVLSASKLVFAVIKRKYEGRVANIDTPVNKLPRSMRGCPMFDGSLDAYFPIWDQDAHQNGTHGLVPPMPDGTLTMANGQPVYADLWATMTMGWSDGVSDDPNQGLDLTQGQHPTLHLDPSFQETMHLGPSPTGTG
ncbi:Zn 2cys6 transcription factor [Colletotrichum higginsianum]|nr:Zn 2cys6 transcription factor [Colletotrichum higginsianum]